MKGNTKKFIEDLIGPTTIGMLIRTYRTTNDLTQAQLAKKLKVTVSYVSDLENDRKEISLKQAKEIALKLGDPVRLYLRIWMEQKAREAGIDFEEIIEARINTKSSRKKVS